MAKASFKIPNGANVSIVGTPKEIQEFLALYTGTTEKLSSPTEERHIKKEDREISTEKKVKPEKADVEKIIQLAKTCKEADSIGKYILDQTNEANRVLVPLYIVHEYLDNAFALSTSQISEVTIGLGAKVSRQNALRAVKFSAPGHVIKLSGKSPRYKIHRRGLAHLKSVIAGEEVSETIIEKSPAKKASKSRKSSKGSKGGPQTYMLELKNSGFFEEKRTIADIQRKLEELGHIYAQTSLSTPLLRLTRSKKLSRVKENDSWYYISKA
ncbi:MAG: hypothetical protein HND47_09810 [Chloroflexi bacterium]|nr:hypothetical protein [Chloroflexota bacterium]